MKEPVKFDGIPCFDQLCEVCERLFRGPGPTDGKCLKRLHHSIQRLQASAKSDYHLCNLMLGILDKEVLRELTEEAALEEEMAVSSTSYKSQSRCLCVALELGEFPKLKISGSRFWKPTTRSLPYDALNLEPGDEYCLNQIFYFPAFKIDLPLPDSNQQADRILVHRTKFSSTLNNVSVGLIRKWIWDCHRSHPSCRQGLGLDQKHPPRRLLELRGKDAGDVSVRVRQTKDLHELPQYVTLSHRWKPEPTCLLRDNLATYETALPLTDLPKHFDEAIRLCSCLGYGYIWIDSLCIIQDSGDDWAHEAGRMGYIYANSALTFAATAASDAPDGNCGLNYDRSYLEVAPCIIQASWENGEHHNFVCWETCGWQHHVEGPDLHNRGWVVQERLLSPRTIHFAADQIYWECPSSRASEFVPSGPIPHQPDYVAEQNLKCLLRRARGGTGEAMSFDKAWTDILRLYTRTELSHETDRIVAISGIVTALSNAFSIDSSDFVMGLWISRLPYQLLWYAEGLDFDDRPIVDTAPSWSWLSCGGGVEFDDIFWSGTPLVSVLEIDETSLYLRGQVCAMIDLLKFVKIDNQTLPVKGDIELWKHQLFELIHWNNSWLGLREGGFTERLFFCPVVTLLEDQDGAFEEHVHGLVLQPTRKAKGQYQRVGTLNMGYLGERRYGCRVPKNYSTKKLDESLFRDFDKEKGYTIVVV